jgi:hypothetical protein
MQTVGNITNGDLHALILSTATKAHAEQSCKCGIKLPPSAAIVGYIMLAPGDFISVSFQPILSIFQLAQNMELLSLR